MVQYLRWWRIAHERKPVIPFACSRQGVHRTLDDHRHRHDPLPERLHHHDGVSSRTRRRLIPYPRLGIQRSGLPVRMPRSRSLRRYHRPQELIDRDGWIPPVRRGQVRRQSPIGQVLFDQQRVFRMRRPQREERVVRDFLLLDSLVLINHLCFTPYSIKPPDPSFFTTPLNYLIRLRFFASVFASIFDFAPNGIPVFIFSYASARFFARSILL